MKNAEEIKRKPKRSSFLKNLKRKKTKYSITRSIVRGTDESISSTKKGAGNPVGKGKITIPKNQHRRRS